MESFTKRLWLLFFIIFLSVGGIAFQYFFYYGIVKIEGIDAPFDVIIENKGIEKCSLYPCSFYLSPGEHLIQIQKEGFESKTAFVSVTFQETIPLSFSLQKKPILNSLKKNNFQSFEAIYTPPTEENISYLKEDYRWDGQKLLFEGQTFARFSEEKIGVSSDEIGRGLWGFSHKNIYFIDRETQQKFLLKEGNIEAVRPLKNGMILFFENKKVKILTPDGEMYSIPDNFLGIHAFCAFSPRNFIGILKHSPNRYEMALYSLDTETIKSLSELKNFDISDFDFFSCNSGQKSVLQFKKGEDFLFEF